MDRPLQLRRSSSGAIRQAGLPSLAQALQAYSVTNPALQEGISWTLYDSIAYPAAGLATATFFSIQQGQGTGFGGVTGKTLSDTNMQLGSQLPQGQNFLVQAIEVDFQYTTPTVAAGMPAAFGAQAVAVQVNDTYIFRRSGNLQFNILSKPYLWDAPLMKFPSTSTFHVSAALADVTSAAASLQSRIAAPFVGGPRYNIRPVMLTSNMAFNVTLNWPEGLQAISNPARIFVRLCGTLYRTSQ